jgi:hypothetical protein
MNVIDERSRWDWELKYTGQKNSELKKLVQELGPPPVGLIEEFEDVVTAWAEVGKLR